MNKKQEEIGCGKDIPDKTEENTFYICGKSEIIEPNGNRYFKLCSECKLKEKLK
jgi:hypothetical protein